MVGLADTQNRPQVEAGPLRRGATRLLRRIGANAEAEWEGADAEMLHSVVELGQTLTREVMVPRTDMVTAAAGQTLSKVMSLFVRSGYSRVPVVGESIDDVRGIVYFKDVARLLIEDSGAGLSDVATTVRPAVFVPESKPVDDLLREMQAAHAHMALVVDEFGGIAGLVTIEDAIEEIVGEIVDEHDRDAPEPEAVGPGLYRVPARLPLDELGDLFGIEIDDDDVATAGGLLAKALGRVPIVGARASVQGLRLEAERTQGRRKQLATLLVEPADQDREEN